jgi:predicted transcriptional regulator
MMVSLRLKDELIAEIDRVASAHGQTRSAWIASTLARSVLAPVNDSCRSSINRAGAILTIKSA